MEKALWTRIENVFYAAIEVPAEQRSALVQQLAAGDDLVWKEVESLLQKYRDDDTWLSGDAENQLRETVQTTMQLLAEQGAEHPTWTQSEHDREAQRLMKSWHGQADDWIAPYKERFRLVRPLGQGGMGVVFEAFDHAMQRPVALKFLPSERIPNHDTDRALRESRAIASIQSDHIVAIYEINDQQPCPFLVMELIRGPSIRDWIQRRDHIPSRFAAETLRQIALGLSDAHSKNLLHGDIKPTNVLLQRRCGTTQRWRAKIIDFGIASTMLTANSGRSSGIYAGTPTYMSPERLLREGVVDSRSDIYSAGVLLYEMLTGETPHSGSAATLIQRARGAEPRSPRELNPDIPQDLEAICMKAIAKSPEARYANAKALAEDLSRFLEGRPTLARPVSLPVRAMRWAKRNRALATAMGSAFALLTSLVVLSAASAWIFREKVNQIASIRSRADQLLMEKIPSAHPAFIPQAVVQIQEQVDAPNSALKALWSQHQQPQPRFNLACAMTMLGEPMQPYLAASVLETPVDLGVCLAITRALEQSPPLSLAALADELRNQDLSDRNRVRLALLAFYLGDDSHAKVLFASPENIELQTLWVHLFPNWNPGLGTTIENLHRSPHDSVLAATLLGIGLLDAASISSNDRNHLSMLLTDWSETSPHPYVRAASQWLIVRWASMSNHSNDSNSEESLPSSIDRRTGMNFRMVPIPAGTFVMGNDDSSLQYEGRSAHPVTLSRPFLLADREVSIRDFELFLRESLRSQDDAAENLPDGVADIRWSPDRVISPTDAHPAQRVTWTECVAFCNWLSAREGLRPAYTQGPPQEVTLRDNSVRSITPWIRDETADGYRLPTEAEFEYASRAGTQAAYFFGDDRSLMDQYVAWSNNTRIACQPTGHLMPNGFGLFDMLGNVWEWTDDWYRDYPESAERDPRGTALDPRGIVFRGGGICTFSGDPVCSSRGSSLPESRFLNVGFRVARNAE